jgi:hypothetical protein
VDFLAAFALSKGKVLALDEFILEIPLSARA